MTPRLGSGESRRAQTNPERKDEGDGMRDRKRREWETILLRVRASRARRDPHCDNLCGVAPLDTISLRTCQSSLSCLFNGRTISCLYHLMWSLLCKLDINCLFACYSWTSRGLLIHTLVTCYIIHQLRDCFLSIFKQRFVVKKNNKLYVCWVSPNKSYTLV